MLLPPQLRRCILVLPGAALGNILQPDRPQQVCHCSSSPCRTATSLLRHATAQSGRCFRVRAAQCNCVYEGALLRFLLMHNIQRRCGGAQGREVWGCALSMSQVARRAVVRRWLQRRCSRLRSGSICKRRSAALPLLRSEWHKAGRCSDETLQHGMADALQYIA